MEIPINIEEKKEVAELQSHCNTLEELITAKLKSLKAGIDPKNKKVTEGVFETFTGPRSELGKVIIKEGGDGKNTALINNKEVKVEIFRS